MNKKYATEKQYNEWLSLLRKGIETILSENNLKYKLEIPKYEEEKVHYIVEDIPGIGNYAISVETYDNAKNYLRGYGVDIFSIFSSFETFRDKENELPYREYFNEISGKYNFLTSFSDTIGNNDGDNQILDKYLYALKSIMKISNELKR